MNRQWVAAVAWVGLIGTAWAADKDVRQAVDLMQAGKLGEAQRALEALVEQEPRNAEARERLGDVYRKQGLGEPAEREYLMARELGRRSAALLNNLATVQTWNRRFSASRASYREALAIDPDDREAREGLDALRRKRGLAVFGAIGPWEADTSVKGFRARQADVFYGGLDRLDLYAGASSADKLFYQRTSYYAKGYVFLTPSRYLKLRVGQRNYSYPVGGIFPQPDANAYGQVPTVEVEIADRLGPSWDASLAYEYFRPDFFWDPSAHANNHKLSAELGYRTEWRPLRLIVMPAVLRDPDPNETAIDLVGGRVTRLAYNTQWLLGGGADLTLPHLDAKGLFIQNRDLDQSYAYSILAHVGAPVTSTVSMAFDYIYDVYSRHSTFDGETAHLSTVSVAWTVAPGLDLSAGPKLIVRPTGKTAGAVDRETETGGFLTLRVQFAL